MKIIRFASIVLVSSALLASCGEQASTDADATRDSNSSSQASAGAESTGRTLADAAPDGSRIPDGTWVKTSTTADAKRLGIRGNAFRPILGQDGKFHVELRIKGDHWAQFGDDGDAQMAQGEGGTGGYDVDGNWVTTSTGVGCYGCEATIGWSVAGDRLTLTLLDHVTTDDPEDVLVGRLVREGTYTRTR